MSLCQDLRQQEFVSPYSIECWIEDFREFVRTKGETDFPLKSGSFEYYLERWPEETVKGKIA